MADNSRRRRRLENSEQVAIATRAKARNGTRTHAKRFYFYFLHAKRTARWTTFDWACKIASPALFRSWIMGMQKPFVELSYSSGIKSKIFELSWWSQDLYTIQIVAHIYTDTACNWSRLVRIRNTGMCSACRMHGIFPLRILLQATKDWIFSISSVWSDKIVGPKTNWHQKLVLGIFLTALDKAG